MTVSILVAIATNGVIGRNNDLPWGKLSTDLKRLKSLTMGHHMVMGRRTFNSIGNRALPGRTTIVVSHSGTFDGENVKTARSVEEALQLAAGDDEIFIMGGAEIYRQSLHLADRMYITRVHAEPEGDTFFPEFDDVREWQLVDSEHYEADEKNAHPFSFLTYERVARGERPPGEDEERG